MTTVSSEERAEPEAARKGKPAGGKAGGGGFGFQANAATWLAVHILARLPLGSRFGIDIQAVPTSIRLETGEGLDDIEVGLDDGGTIQLQAKTRPKLSDNERSGLKKTLGQLARLTADHKAGAGLPDLNRHVAVLAVRGDAPQTLDRLSKALRSYDLGGDWSSTKASRNEEERKALDLFEALVGEAWKAHRGAEPSEQDLADMARFFRITRFTMDEGDSDWREASRLLGRHLYGSEADGDAPLRDLAGILFHLIGSGAPATRPGLLRELRRRGHADVGAPGFEQDIARLKAVTTAELTRLAPHARLPLASGIPLYRTSDAPLVAAIRRASGLIIGEPGAGKTGALVNAANLLHGDGETIVFLSVDNYPGVAIAADLQSELGLKHRLADLLGAFPGGRRKILFIDALDAARGGPSEAVFAALIEEIRSTLAEEWTVIASIRTFDLKNGRRYREAFAGAALDPAFADPGLGGVAHFLVPRLTDADLEAAAAASSELKTLLASAPAPLKALLHNIFNLSLAAELLNGGADPNSFARVKSQSDLIDAYEDARLTSTELEKAASATVGAMAARRRLMVRKVVVDHPELDELIHRGLLAETGDKVSFSHHVLFDHVAGRFYLEWDDPSALEAQLAGDPATALLLAPALRFAIERLWRSDGDGKHELWAMIGAVFAAETIDAVLANVALRTAVENVTSSDDIDGLIALIRAKPKEKSVAALIGRLSRFAGLDMDAAGSVDPARAIAWARLAKAAVESNELMLADAGRFMVHSLFERADLAEPELLNIFGAASRTLLTFAWGHDPRLQSIATNAIRFVAKSFASHPKASRALLVRILEEPHFSAYADQEANWLAEQIGSIAATDPEFAAQIYAGIYGQAINDSSTSHFGGSPSRIMPLSSNRRQDFEMARWQLGKAMGEFLTISPSHGTRALIDADIGLRDHDHAETLDLGGGRTTELRGHDYELNHWSESDPDRLGQDDDILKQYVDFLRSCSRDEFAESLEAAAQTYATASIWARLLGIGAERVDELGDLLWPYVEGPGLFESHETLRDAVNFTAAAYPHRSAEERTRFEQMALDIGRYEEEHDRAARRLAMGRLLALVADSDLVLDETRVLRRELEEAGELVANTPLSRFRIRRGDSTGYEREMMRRDGIDVDCGPDAAIMSATDKLDERISKTGEDDKAAAIARLWEDTIALAGQLDALQDQIHDKIARAGWGRVATAAERIASSDACQPGAKGVPPVDELIALIDRLAASPFPAPPDDS